MNARTQRSFLSLRKRRRQALLQRMEQMRAAKERKRLERGPVEAEPKYNRDPMGLSLGVRDDATGEVAWAPFRSLRDALRRLAVVRREYVPGIPTK